jgi:hypothetical protein
MQAILSMSGYTFCIRNEREGRKDKEGSKD